MRIPANICQNYAQSSRLEWLETNGTGAFAMGTVSGANSRRYHGYFVADPGSTGRQVWLAKVDEELNGQLLGANRFPGSVYPDGYRHLADFSLDPYPTWTYMVDGLLLRKSLFLVPGRAIAVVQYAASVPCRLAVRPFLAGRDYHHLLQRHDVPSGLHLQSAGGALEPHPDWWKDLKRYVMAKRFVMLSVN